MGVGFYNLYLTNTGDNSGKIYLTAWKPVKEEGRYYWPPNTPIGGDLWVNNCIDLKKEAGTVPVKIIRSDTETGVWLCCSNGYFLDEQWIYDHKHKKGDPIKNDNDFGIHVNTDIEMVDGDDPIPVSFEIISAENKKRRKWTVKIFLIHLKNAIGNFLGIKE